MGEEDQMLWLNAEEVKKACAFVVGALLMAVFIYAVAGCAGTRPHPRSETPIADHAVNELRRVHFSTGSDKLDDEAIATLGFNASWLERYPNTVLVLEGHCDERGDAAFNMQLGDRRARRVKAHLISTGIDPDRMIMVVSHGELRPLDPRHTSDAWRKNRRVEFIIR
jgi:peptidoglycan-associated lipoprotein